MSGLAQDLRFAVRSLVKRPGFTLLAIATLALGIGATAAMFSVTHALLLRPLPYRDADRVMVLWRLSANVEGASPFSFPTIEDLQARNRTFESLAVFVEKDLNLTGNDGEPESIRGLQVSADLPAALGVTPHAGRSFSAADDAPGAPPTVLLSHELWSARFGAEEELISQPVTLDGQQYTVIGILPPGLRSRKLGPYYAIGDFWVPIGLFRDQIPRSREERPGLFLVGRLKPDVSVAEARSDVERIARELAAEHALLRSSEIAAVEIFEDSVAELRPVLRLLIGAVGFVLLITCANLTSLLLTRTAARRHEFAARTAVGAGRLRLVRQVITENLVLGLLGAAAGLLLAQLAVAVLVARLPRDTFGHVEISIGGPVLAFTALVALAAVVAAGLAPALQAGRASFHEVMRVRSAPAPRRLKQLLVGGEIAIALILTIGALLMLGSLLRLRQQDPGFDPRNVLSAQMTLPMPKYAESSRWVAFFERALEEVERLPGVRGAAVTSALPLVVGNQKVSVLVAGDRPLPPPGETANTLYQMVSADYFRLLGIPLVSGRAFSPLDDDRRGSRHVVIISETLARHFWPGPRELPIGRRIAFELQGTPANPEPLWREVIGVVGDVRHASLRSSSRNAVYVPYTQPGLWFEGEWPTMALVIKTEGDPAALVRPVRDGLLRIDPDQPVHGVQSLGEALSAELGELRAIFALLATFAFLAVALALVGVYGIVAQSVADSVREVGIRVAMGATPSQVIRGYLRQSLPLVGVSLAAGLAVGAVLSRSLSSLLYDIGSLDPFVFAAAALALALAASLATIVPSWQASRLDANEALREE